MIFVLKTLNNISAYSKLNKNIILINVTFQFLLRRDYCLEIMIELLILQTDFCGFQQYDEFSLYLRSRQHFFFKLPAGRLHVRQGQ